MARRLFLNVNFPDVTAKAVSGVSIVPEGRRKSGYNSHEMQGPHRLDQCYIIGNAIEGGEISITPHHCDLTAYSALRSLSKSSG